MNHFQATVIEHSISPQGIQLHTMETVHPRFIHAECKTHRKITIDGVIYEVMEDIGFMDDPNLSRNASSSRAIPTSKLIEMVRTNPVMPIYWGKNRPGMQADEELTGFQLQEAKGLWRFAAEQAVYAAEEMLKVGVHKQIVNRILEPFLPIRVVVTATEWANFFGLRRHPAAQPEMKHLADLMWEAMQASKPRLLQPGEWHLPYVTEDEIKLGGGRTDPSGDLRKVSAARAARVSYRTHDGRISTLKEDLALCERLMAEGVVHASPFEHQATPDEYEPHAFGKRATWKRPHLHGNLQGWRQNRKSIPNECIR